jgi:S-adenosylmethionine synthetase
MCETFGTNHVPEDVIDKLVREVFDLRPAKILENLRLRRPIYKATAAYGHFGRTDIDAPWELTDRVTELRQLAGLGQLATVSGQRSG